METVQQPNQDVIIEGMTSISALIRAVKSGTNNRKIKKIMFDEVKSDAKQKDLDFLRSVCSELDFSVESASPDEIASLSSGRSHGGIIAVCTPRSFDTLVSPDQLSGYRYLAYLDGIEDPFNFGYCLRSLYASGCEAIILSDRNWSSAAGVVARSSAGTSELFPAFLAEKPEQAVELVKYSGFSIISAGIRDSVSCFDADLSLPLLLVIGGEKRGISRSILDLSDRIVRIDYGQKFRGSLTAAATCAVLGFEIMRQNRNL